MLKALRRQIRAGQAALAVLLLIPAVAFAQSGETRIELSEGNIVLSEQDGTQITMAAGSDVILGEDEDGVTIITLNAGDVFMSNVLHETGEPIRLRMGDEIIEISRASVLVSREADNMDVTLLHGQQVSFATGAVLSQAGTRMRMDAGGSAVDRPSAATMAEAKGALGAVSRPVGGGNLARAGAAAALLPSSPQTQVPSQVQLQGSVQSAVTAQIPRAMPPMMPPDMPPMMPPDMPPDMPDDSGGGLPFDDGFLGIVGGS